MSDLHKIMYLTMHIYMTKQMTKTFLLKSKLLQKGLFECQHSNIVNGNRSTCKTRFG